MTGATHPESRRIPLELGLLCLAALLAPLIGGHVSVTPRAVELGLLGEVFGGGALPYLARLILALPILAGFAILAMQNRIIQLPNIRLMALLTLLIGLLGIGILAGKFPYSALGEWLSWFIYGGALFLTVAAGGRVRGLNAVLAALCIGITLLAIRGIFEYVGMMAREPSYRIFAGWTNPNAVASVLVAGTLLMAGLAASLNRWAGILAGVGSFAAMSALILTQSKGAFLAVGIGVIVLLGTAILGRAGWRRTSIALLPLALGAVFAFGLGRMAANNAASAPAFSRLVAAGTTSEQSVGFRQNLWKSAVAIASDHPMGVGPGGFRYYSTQPGLTESTVHAHQSYLQLAVEGGWFTLAIFGALTVVWVGYAFRGFRVQPPERRILRGGILAGAFGLAAHGMTESNLSYVGAGIVLFILVGLSLQLSTDGTSPEALPRSIRMSVVLACCVFPLLGLAIFAAGEAKKATLMNALASGERDAVISAIDGLARGNYGDPEAAYLVALYGSRSEEDRADNLVKVSATLPTPRVLRATVRSLMETGQIERALALNQKVFDIDPNNLKAWLLQLELHQTTGNTQEAIRTAEKLIRLEQSPSFQVRAIPEMVPTETYEARLFIADRERDPVNRAKLLREAITGFNRYATTSVPLVIQMTDAGLESYAGETREESARKLKLAETAVQDYLRILESPGVRESEGESVETVTEMSKSFAVDLDTSRLR